MLIRLCPRSPEWRMTTVRTSGSPRTPPTRRTQSPCLIHPLQSAYTATPHTTATSAVKIGKYVFTGCKLCPGCSNVCVPLSPYLIFTLRKFLIFLKKYLQGKNKLLIICRYQELPYQIYCLLHFNNANQGLASVMISSHFVNLIKGIRFTCCT